MSSTVQKSSFGVKKLFTTFFANSDGGLCSLSFSVSWNVPLDWNSLKIVVIKMSMI